MADKKISELTASTTPLVGSETLPIVQSGVTKQVSVDNLTAGKTVKTGNVLMGASASALAGGGTGATIFHATAPEIKFLNTTTGAAATDGTALQAISTNFAITNREAGQMTFATSNSVRMTVEIAGDVTIETGDLIIGASGKGLNFGSNVKWRTGAGSPEGAVTAAVGSLYTRTDGGLLTTLYVKESGAGNTGWVAK
jgi:hypothetical protein